MACARRVEIGVTNGKKAEKARKEARHFKIQAISISILLIPPAVVLYFLVSIETFTAVTVLATWIVSIYTLSETILAKAKAAEAKAAGYENPS